MHWISLRDKQKILKTTLGLKISHEYIRKEQLVTNELFWRNKKVTAPEILNYDVQWIPTDSGWSYFHMLIDNRSKKIVAVQLTPDEEKETTKKFFKKVFHIWLKVIITDLKSGYHQLIKDELNIEHQGCLIHFKKALNKKIKKELNKIKNKIQGSILFENPDITDSELEKELEDTMEPIYEEYWFYKEDVMKTFDYEDYDEASNYIQDLRYKAKDYPKAICKIFDRQFF